MSDRTRTLNLTRENADGSTLTFRILGAPRLGWQDLYHGLLSTRPLHLLLGIVGIFLALNLIFGLAYLLVGGVANARAGSLADAFFFSVQTIGTIGYGAMYPTSVGANVLVVIESFVGTLMTALATGLVFVRFSLTRPRLAFSKHVAIAPLDGVPTLMLRVGNERGNNIRDAQFRLMMTRTTRTSEGIVIYRTFDLALVRDRAPALSRAWNVLHVIGPASPLLGETPESLAAADAELSFSLVGTDETSLQPVHGQTTWDHGGIVWGHRLADILDEPDAQTVVVDLHRFHELVRTDPSEAFPYPRAEAARGLDAPAPIALTSP